MPKRRRKAMFGRTTSGEQISTAVTEASGISNMKPALNAAVTIGTPDGASGLRAAEIQWMREQKSYLP